MGWLESVVGFVVWTVANVAYGRFRASGEGGFKRLFAFWAGMPLTWVTLVVVREGVPMLEGDDLDPDDELRELRAAIRDDRDRREALPPSAATGLPESGDDADSEGRADDPDGWKPLST